MLARGSAHLLVRAMQAARGLTVGLDAFGHPSSSARGFEPRGSRVGASVPRRPHLCSSSGVAISPSVMTLAQKPAATGHQPDPPLWDRPRCCPSASGRATIWPATDVPAGVAVIGLARTYDCRDATLNCAVVCTRVRLVGLREHELVGVNALRAHPEMRHVSRQRQGAGDVSVGRIRAGRTNTVFSLKAGPSQCRGRPYSYSQWTRTVHPRRRVDLSGRVWADCVAVRQDEELAECRQRRLLQSAVCA
jgi:hypothetical protein